ncbi:TB2/DP1, HVA22 family-domain-containing protein [Sporodiniella umbellata]|nr:TB2/DP1, HVA22 family-domain-containing protein [Sporodiniella umbellata]
MFIELIYGIIKFIFLQFYPCFITFKAIRLEKATDYVSLLTFWVVSVLFLSVEYFADFFLFWLPFYTEFKLLFLIWLILPQTQGTAVFYSKYVEPFFEHHQSGIEHTLIRFQQSLKTMVFSWLQRFLPSQVNI